MEEQENEATTELQPQTDEELAESKQRLRELYQVRHKEKIWHFRILVNKN